MEKLEKTLNMIMELLKGAPVMVSGNIPKLPKPVQPAKPVIKPVTASPVTNKNPVNVAQQIKDPSVKSSAIKQAKSLVKFDKNGQWSLD